MFDCRWLFLLLVVPSLNIFKTTRIELEFEHEHDSKKIILFSGNCVSSLAAGNQSNKDSSLGKPSK